MKLYYSAGSCTIGVQIILEETGTPYELVPVALKDQAQHGEAFRAINPKSKIPVLELDDGTLLTEWPAIAYYLAASKPASGLLPKSVLEQAQALEIADYVVGFLHAQSFARIFRPENFTLTESDKPKVQEAGKANVAKGLGIIEQQWKGGEWLLPGGFSMADCALFYIEYWAIKRVGLEVPAKIAAHFERMLARPAVAAALQKAGMA